MLLYRPWNSSSAVMKLSGQPCEGIGGFKRFVAELRVSSFRGRLIGALVSKIGVNRMTKYTLMFGWLLPWVTRSVRPRA
jgi:hypothetical protein